MWRPLHPLGSPQFLRECDLANLIASSIAARMLDGSALPVPAMSNAVP